MRIIEIKCKTALSNSSLPGLDYSLNPYRGCQHNCIYCYVPNVLRIQRNEWGTFVDIRKNIPSVLSKELKNKKPGVVGISTITDPYQPIEKQYRLTRYCLEQLLRHDFPVCIQTKSSLILRDIDIIPCFSKAEVMITIATLNDDERRLLEPNSSPVKDRLDALKKYSEIGVKTSVFFGPIYPTIKKEDLPEIIDTFVENGVNEIMLDKFNLKPGILNPLEKLFPDHKNLLKDHSYFRQIFDETQKICKQKNLKAVSAF
jgi:DNA repair photolyase